jgi:predicted transcriptional regulator
MMSKSRIHQAILDPSSVYRSPEELATDEALVRAEKLTLLALWEADARELAVAEEENMGGGEPSRLDDILAWRQRLGAAAEHEAASDNKQGVSAEPDIAMIRVRHFLRPSPDNIHPDMGAAEARRRFADQDLKLLAVTDGTEVVGTLTPTDLERSGNGELAVRHMMNVHLTFCFADDGAATALMLLERQASDCLLVIESDGVLIGMLCRDDLPAMADRAPSSLGNSGSHDVTSGAVASTIQPGGLQVYPDRPTIKFRPTG